MRWAEHIAHMEEEETCTPGSGRNAFRKDTTWTSRPTQESSVSNKGNVRMTQQRGVFVQSLLPWWSSITYCGFVCAALRIQHAMRMRRIILLSKACLALKFFSTLSHKQHDFREINIKCVFWFSLQPLSETSHSTKKWANIYLVIHYLQLGRHPVTGVVTCYISTDYENFTLKFRYGGLHEKHVVATWNCREPSQYLLKDPGKSRKTWDEMAGLRTFRVLTFSQSSSI